MGIHKQLRIYMSLRGTRNVNLYIAHLSHGIFKSRGVRGHLVRQKIRSNLKKYAYDIYKGGK